MKYLKMLGLAAVAAMALTAFTAGSASATTLEIGGVAQNKKVEITASLAASSTAVLSTTSGSLSNTCTESHVAGYTTKADGVDNTYTGTRLTGPITALSFDNCHQEEVVVDKMGNLYVEWTANTTGNLFSEEAEVTVPTTANPGSPLNCKTGTGTKIGTVHGVASGHATITINAVLNCGFLVPSATWTGEYIVTSPTGLGVIK